MKKHCDNCKYSYQAVNFSNQPIGQHCSNTKYNSEEYTNDMLMEDWGKGYCRFYEPKERICPICNKEYNGYPALSRTDNITEICSSCGQEQALHQFETYLENNKGKKETE